MSGSVGGNIASVSWPDHLSFGEGDGGLLTPDALARRLDAWRDQLGAGTIHWRLLRTHLASEFFAAPGYQHPTLRAAHGVDWDDLETAPRLAHAAGLHAYLYASVFDDGWPLATAAERQRSYHNAMHCQHVAWQTSFARDRPHLLVIDRDGNPQLGVLCLAYPEVREHLVERFVELLGHGDFDGMFVCLRSQSRPAAFGDQYGFNEPIRRDYSARCGHPLESLPVIPTDRETLSTDPGLQAWRDLCGDYFTMLLRQLREALTHRGLRLAVGAPRGDVIGPPLGNATLQWRTWVSEGLIDQLIINQSSSRCPSMWHDLWPMHRGTGYLQSYLDGSGMAGLHEQLERDYRPQLADAAVELFVARQWDDRSSHGEADLVRCDPVRGLVFSSFRNDNPGPVARGDWRG